MTEAIFRLKEQMVSTFVMDPRYPAIMDPVANPSLKLPSASRWRLGTDALLEEGAQGRRLYGRWDVQFGCWHLSPQGLVPVRPDVPFLGHLGRWIEPEGERDEGWYASRAALAGYFSLIPTSVRRLAAPFGQRQWEVLERIWRDPGFVRTFDQAS